eukprot:498182_1
MLDHYSAIYNDIFTIFGGQNLDGPIPESRSKLIPTGLNVISPWTQNNVALPFNIQGLYFYSDTNVNINEKAYIINQDFFGGTANSYHDMLIYDLNMHTFTRGATPTHEVQNTCIVYNSNNDIIYTIGGYYASISTQYTQRYNVSNNTWITDGADTVNGKYLAGCSMDITNDYIYYFGGYFVGEGSNSQFLDEIQKYSVSMDQWTVLSATLTSPRRGVRCRLLSMDSNIYCIGGKDNGGVSNEVDVFDPASDTVLNTIYLNVGRTSFSAILFNDDKCIIVSGGDVGNYNYLDSIETFGDCKVSTKDPSKSPTKNPSNNPREHFNLSDVTLPEPMLDHYSAIY